MLAQRAIYFADVFSLFFLIVELGANRSHELLYGSSLKFQVW